MLSLSPVVRESRIRKKKEGLITPPERFHAQFWLENLHALCLKALGPFYDIELYRLTFLQATEAVATDGREMDENIVAGLAADKTEAFGIVI